VQLFTIFERGFSEHIALELLIYSRSICFVAAPFRIILKTLSMKNSKPPPRRNPSQPNKDQAVESNKRKFEEEKEIDLEGPGMFIRLAVVLNL
jgi:hypothetical protein